MIRQSNTKKVSSHQSPVARKKLETGNWKLMTLGFSALIVLLAFALRFHNLGVQSFWNDEGSSYVQATRSFADIAANAARDIHPPGYYWLLAIWRTFTGDSEFALRSLSAFASVLTVAFTYALGKRLFNPAAGLAAALFVTLNTFSIYYAQEARMYALLALWSVMGMYFLTTLLKAYPRRAEGQRNRGLANTSSSPFSGLVFFGSRMALASGGLALINAAGLYTQYAYPFVMLAQGMIFLVWLGGRIVRTRHVVSLQILGLYVAANVLTILLYLPWLPTALTQVTQWPSTGEPISNNEALGTIIGWFAIGITFESNLYTRGPIVGLIWLNVISILITIFGIFRWMIVSGRKILGRFALPLLWVIVPVGLFLILGLFRPANLKFLLPSQIGFALCMGFAIAGWWGASPSGWLKRLHKLFAIFPTITFATYILTSIPPLYSNPAYQRPDYRTIVATITADPRPGDAVILDAPNQEEVFRYYYKNDAPIYPLPPGLGGNDSKTATLTQDIINRHDRIFVLFWGETERDPNHIVENSLDSQTFQAGIDQWYGDVRFAVYVTPADMPDLTPVAARFGDSITLQGYALSAITIQSGDVLQVRLDWETDAPLSTPYKVFLQLLNSDGKVVTQRDAEPGGGSLPTQGWTAGETVTDRHGLTIPTDLPPGSYQLIVGLYNRDDPSARLPVGTSDYLDLGSITVGG